MGKLIPVEDMRWDLVNKDNRSMVEEFLDQSVHLSDQTLKQYDSALKIFFYWIYENCNNKHFSEIKSIDYLKYQNWLTKNGLSPSAVKLKRSTVSSFNQYVELYYLETYPTFRNYVTKKIPNPVPSFVNEKNPLNLEEYRLLCNELEKRKLYQQLAYVKFTFSTGCRKSESKQLLKSDIYLDPIIKDVEITDKEGVKKKVESRSYHTSEIRCKGRGKVGKPRRLQFDQEAMDALKKWLEVRGEDDNPYVFITKKGLEVKQISGDTFNLWCNTIFESIVGRRVHPHLFRESRCTTLVVEQGKDIKIAQRLLGHNSSETTEIYVIRKDNDASDEAFV